MSVTGWEGCHSSEGSDTDEFTAVSGLFVEIRLKKKEVGRWREDERRKMNLP